MRRTAAHDEAPPITLEGDRGRGARWGSPRLTSEFVSRLDGAEEEFWQAVREAASGLT